MALYVRKFRVRCKFENSNKFEIQIQPQSLFATQVNLADFEGWITLFPPGCGPGSGPDDDGNPDIPAVYLAMKAPERERRERPRAARSS